MDNVEMNESLNGVSNLQCAAQDGTGTTVGMD